jgi:hypothetical protein
LRTNVERSLAVVDGGVHARVEDGAPIARRGQSDGVGRLPSRHGGNRPRCVASPGDGRWSGPAHNPVAKCERSHSDRCWTRSRTSRTTPTIVWNGFLGSLIRMRWPSGDSFGKDSRASVSLINLPSPSFGFLATTCVGMTWHPNLKNVAEFGQGSRLKADVPDQHPKTAFQRNDSCIRQISPL